MTQTTARHPHDTDEYRELTELARQTWNLPAELRVFASLTDDNDAHPNDADCYDETDIAAFENGEWRYVGISVQVAIGDLVLGQADLWGIEDGALPQGEDAPPRQIRALYEDYPVHELVGEALRQAQITLAKLGTLSIIEKA